MENNYIFFSWCTFNIFLDDQRAGFQKRIKQLEIQLEEEEAERQSAFKQRKEAELKLNVNSQF